MPRINPKKTKIMIFQRCTKKCDYVFHIRSEIIDNVQNYAYLGTRIASSGNFTLSLEHLRQKALHDFFGLRRHTDFNKLKPSLACEILDSMISPILTYNSEWGGGTGGRETGRKGGGRCTGGGRRGGGKRDSQGGGKREKKGKITQHCAIFRNRKNAEGREPKNTGREPGLQGTGSGRFKPPCPPLREKEESSIVKQSLKISIDLHYNGHNSFYSSVMKMIDYYNFCDFNCNSF